MITTILKRDGRKIPYSRENIAVAVWKSLFAVQKVRESRVKSQESRVGQQAAELTIVENVLDKKSEIWKEAQRLSEIVEQILIKSNGTHTWKVEEIQDVVEQVLLAAGHREAAEAYILYRNKKQETRQKLAYLGGQAGKITENLGMSENAVAAMAKRYLWKDKEGNVIETPREAMVRVATAVANAENQKSKGKSQKFWKGKFLEIMTSFEFVPGGCYFRGAGNKQNGSLANCFVLPVEDSIEKIFDAVKWAALIHQMGGGTGFNFSHLRPRGDIVRSGGLSSGPINFMKAFDAETQIVMQGGVHRGANMGILNVDHPDIFQFIRAKSVDGEISNFNISVGAFDGFMRAVKVGKDWALVNPRDKTTVQKIPARGLWDEMVNLAHSTGDPGMIYLDAVNRANPVLKSLGPIESTNVCVVGSTLVQTDQGNVTIENIVKNRLDVKVQTGKGRFENVIGFWDKGKKQVFELSSQQGLKIKATADHRFLTPAGFIELSKLQVGGLVVIYQLGNQIEDTIISIKPTGEEQVFDLTVEPGHQIVTDGFVTHNCGEQPLHPFDVCNLGSINLAKFVAVPWWKKISFPSSRGAPIISGRRGDPGEIATLPPVARNDVNWQRLEEVVRTAVRFLDDGIDASTYPIPQISDMAHRLRRIGLGVMGWADMLVKLGVRYDSDEGIKFAEMIMKFIQEISWDESERLAKEKAEFPLWEQSYFNSKNNPFGKIRQVRNVAVTTIAPTGTISMIADCSSGIEPYFALEYTKNVVEKKGLKYVNKYYQQASQAFSENSEYSDSRNVSKSEDRNIGNSDSPILRPSDFSGTPSFPSVLKSIFRTAHEISPEWHVKMQAAFQKYTDNAVSKTINFPGNATIADIEKAYMLAWELGCKGITVYRDGSREGQILRTKDEGRRTKANRNLLQSSAFSLQPSKQRLMQSQMKITPLSQRAYQVERRKITEDLADGHCPECGAAMTSESGCSTCYSCGYSKCSL